MPLPGTDYGSQGDHGWAKADTCRRTAEKLLPHGIFRLGREIVPATSVQTGHVFRDRLDLLLRHAEGGAGHGLGVIGAVTSLESQQLFLGISGILA